MVCNSDYNCLCSCVHTHTHTHTHTCKHTCKHTSKHTNTHAHTQTHTSQYPCSTATWERGHCTQKFLHCPMTLLNLNRDLLLLLSEFTFTACLCWFSNLGGSMWRWNVSELSHETILKHLIGHFLVGSDSNSNVCWWTRGSSSNLTEDN